MKALKLNDWLQILAAVGVILGLLFVAEELRQNNKLARAQSVREIYLEWQEIYRFSYANDVGLLLQKSIEKPVELTDAEILRLSDYYYMYVGAYLMQVAMERRFDLAYDADDYLFDLAPMFASEYGRAWLRENERHITTESGTYLESLKIELDKLPERTSYEYLDELRASPARSGE